MKSAAVAGVGFGGNGPRFTKPGNADTALCGRPVRVASFPHRTARVDAYGGDHGQHRTDAGGVTHQTILILYAAPSGMVFHDAGRAEAACHLRWLSAIQRSLPGSYR